MKIAFQMEPMRRTVREETHTLSLMHEACRRGFDVFCYEPKTLSLMDGKVTALVRSAKVDIAKIRHYRLGKSVWQDLAEMDVVMIRQDPPFNMEYITTTYLLEKIHPKTFVVNHPTKIRDYPEKLYPLLFNEYMPPTLITADTQLINNFKNIHHDIVIKPLYSFHGNGIKRAGKAQKINEVLPKKLRDPVMVQPFIPEIKEGNKRVVFINGKIAGAINTVPPSGEFIIYRGSTDHAYELNDRDSEICEAVGAQLKKDGIVFAGIDMIGDYLTEINITSVGSIRRINRIYDTALERDIWDGIQSAASFSTQ